MIEFTKIITFTLKSTLLRMPLNPFQLTASQARQMSEKISLVDNRGGVAHCYKLIHATASLGYSQISLMIYPTMLETVRAAFPNYKVVATNYIAPLYPDLIHIIILW